MFIWRFRRSIRILCSTNIHTKLHSLNEPWARFEQGTSLAHSYCNRYGRACIWVSVFVLERIGIAIKMVCQMVIYCNNTYFSLSTLYILNLSTLLFQTGNKYSFNWNYHVLQLEKHRRQLRYNRVRGSHEIGAGGAFVHLSSPFPSSSNFLFSLIFFFFFFSFFHFSLLILRQLTNS